MKIVHVTGYYIKDMAYQENLLPAGQAVNGHNVTIITGRNEPSFQFNKHNRIKPLGKFKDGLVTINRLEHHYEMPNNRGPILKNLYHNIKNEKPEILFIHDVGFSLLIGIIYKLFNTHISLQMDCHSTEANAANSKLGPAYHLLFGIIIFLFQRCFKSFFGVTPETIEFMHKRYFICKNKIDLLPLPGDAKYLEYKEKICSDWRKKYGFSKKDLLLVHTGKLPEDKETLATLKAFSNLQNKFRNLHLIVAGSITKEFQDTFDSFSGKYQIHFLGWKSSDELREIYSSCDLMVQPGSLSNSFLDAICCGLPVLLDKTPQGMDLTNHNNGYVVPRGNIIKLTQIIETILSKDEMKKLKMNSIIAAKYYDYKTIAKVSIR